mgnify:CR=1 FL=1
MNEVGTLLIEDAFGSAWVGLAEQVRACLCRARRAEL